mmetsp:Transcript_102839/g.291226  ORF Transcript_102839/g.291226 Transcript_102839/m.291226 type:complete len:100 (+) Transcript_102839:155-454(+)
MNGEAAEPHPGGYVSGPAVKAPALITDSQRQVTHGAGTITAEQHPVFFHGSLSGPAISALFFHGNLKGPAISTLFSHGSLNGPAIQRWAEFGTQGFSLH